MSTSSPYSADGTTTVQLTTTTVAFARVTIVSTGKATVSGIADLGGGHVLSGGAADEYVACRLNSAGCERVGVCSEAIAIGDVVYTAASGKFSKTSGGGALAVGTARTSTAANNEQFTFQAY